MTKIESQEMTLKLDSNNLNQAIKDKGPIEKIPNDENVTTMNLNANITLKKKGSVKEPSQGL